MSTVPMKAQPKTTQTENPNPKVEDEHESFLVRFGAWGSVWEGHSLNDCKKLKAGGLFHGFLQGSFKGTTRFPSSFY